MIKENFETSLKIGQKKEKEILNIFRNEGWIGDMLDTGAYGDSWVIKNKIPYVLEIKNEDKYSSSPNICIEIYQGITKKPSGISICESQVCIHTMGNNSIIYRTQYMRLFISANKKKYRIIEYSKSDNENKGLLMSIRDLSRLWWFDKCKTENIPESKIFLKE